MYKNPQFHYWRPTEDQSRLVSNPQEIKSPPESPSIYICVFLLLLSLLFLLCYDYHYYYTHAYRIDVSYKKLTNYYHIYTCTYVRERLHRYTNIHTSTYIYIHILRNTRAQNAPSQMEQTEYRGYAIIDQRERNVKQSRQNCPTLCNLTHSRLFMYNCSVDRF